MKEINDSLEKAIQRVYEEGVSIEEAERLSAQFLFGQMALSKILKDTTLDARMRKSGIKSIRSAVYLEAAKSGEKKPTEGTLAATVDAHEIVQKEQEALDIAEVEKEYLERQFSIYENGHIFMRGVAKGNFGG